MLLESSVYKHNIYAKNRVVPIGFYGDDTLVSSGSYAGWDEFGVLRCMKTDIDRPIDGSGIAERCIEQINSSTESCLRK